MNPNPAHPIRLLCIRATMACLLAAAVVSPMTSMAQAPATPSTTATPAVAAPASAAAPAAPSATALKGDASAARDKVSMCIGCHSIPNYKTAFPIVYSVPRIGGQSEGYIASALHEYKKGERHHPSMRAIAQSLSEQDILDVAAYYSAQHAN